MGKHKIKERRGKSKILISATLSLLLSVSLICMTPNSAQAFVAETIFISVSKKILNKAVKFGLDKAGKTFMKEAWPYAKIVMEPIFDMFPKLLSKDPTEKMQATNQAVKALDADTELIAKIEQRFNSLEIGQKAILDRLNIIEEILSDHEQRIKRLEAATRMEEATSYRGSKWKLSTKTIRFIRLFLESSKNDFMDIRGERLIGFNSYTSNLQFPGADSCLIESRDSYSGASLECDIIYSDFHNNLSPSLVWFTVSELIANIEKAIPADWDRKYPYAWHKDEGLIYKEIYPPKNYHLYDEKRLRSSIGAYQTRGEFYFQEPNNPKGQRIFIYYNTDTRPEEIRTKKHVLGGIEFSAKMLGPAYRVTLKVVSAD